MTDHSTAPDEQPPRDDAPRPTREERLAELAEKLCRSYTYGFGLEEVERTDPEEARAHRDAARHLLPWLEEAPERDRHDAWDRAWELARESQKKRTEEQVRRLEERLADARLERDPEGLLQRVRSLECAWDELWNGHTGRRDITEIVRSSHERAVHAEAQLRQARTLLAQWKPVLAADRKLLGELQDTVAPYTPHDGPDGTKAQIDERAWLQEQPWYEEAEYAADLDNARQLWSVVMPVLLAQRAELEQLRRDHRSPGRT